METLIIRRLERRRLIWDFHFFGCIDLVRLRR